MIGIVCPIDVCDGAGPATPPLAGETVDMTVETAETAVEVIVVAEPVGSGGRPITVATPLIVRVYCGEL